MRVVDFDRLPEHLQWLLEAYQVDVVEADVVEDEGGEPLHEHVWMTMLVQEESMWLPVTTYCECGLTAVDLVEPGVPIPGLFPQDDNDFGDCDCGACDEFVDCE